MKLNDLHTSLSNLQEKLTRFSFDELSAKEADKFRNALNSFKSLLEDKNTMQGNLNNLCTANNNLVSKTTLEEKQQTLQSLLVTAANKEINVPLNGILKFSEKLLKSNLTMEQERIVKEIQASSNNILTVSKDIIDYTGNDAIGTNECTTIKFHNIVKDVLFLCNALILNKSLKLNYTATNTIPNDLIGDPSKLSQILLNLVGNAVQTTQKGEILVVSKLIEETNDKVFIEFTVTDTSFGISEDKLDSVFDFYSQDNSSLGLGLNVAKQLIESIDGTISVSSKVDTGTKFTFILPFKKPEEPTRASLSKGIADIQVLIFEDNKLNQKLIELKLKKWNCKTFITDNCNVGLEILENNPIDIILMDLRMPGKNGDVIAEEIRKNNDLRVKNTPIIAVTADHDIRTSTEFNISNFTEFLLKPYTSDELLSTLLEQIENNANMETLTSNHINDKGDVPKINLTPVLNECMGDIGMLQELIRLFKNNALEFIGKAIVHIRNEDYEGLKFSTHKIKAGLKMMKTEALHDTVLQIENAIKDDIDVKHLNFLYNCFVEEYPIIDQQLDDELLRLAQEA
ncbi:MAG: ATP-binding response regulator [Cellulophaga sp.]